MTLVAVDPPGGSGKTTLCKHLLVNRKDVGIVPHLGSAVQLATSIISGGSFRNFLIDMPRSRPGEEQLQIIGDTVEKLSDGLVLSPMYGKAGRLPMNNPNVLLFANWFLPYKQ